MDRLAPRAIILVILALVLLNNPTLQVKRASAQPSNIAHIGDKYPISVSGLNPTAMYQVNYGFGGGTFQFTFTSTSTGATPTRLTLTILSGGPYVFPPLSASNLREISIHPYGSVTIVASILVYVVPSYTLSSAYSCHGPGSSVVVEGVAFPSGTGLVHSQQVVFGGDPTQTIGTALSNPGTPLTTIPAASIPASGNFITTFIVPPTVPDNYYIWIWEDANGK